MALEIRQVQRLAQQLVMTPQLQQAIKLLQLSRVELEDLISRELQDNPALEEVEASEEEEEAQPAENEPTRPEREVTPEVPTSNDAAKLDWQEYLETHINSIHGALGEGPPRDEEEGPPTWETMVAKKTSLEEYLTWQLNLSRLTPLEQAIGLYLIGNLDERGYLAISLEEVRDTVQASSSEPVALELVERVLKTIQRFDPVGVAARDLKECLLVQLENLNLGSGLAAKIVADHLQQLESKRYDKLAKELGVTVEAIVEAAQLIACLEPKPARGYETEETRTIVPDVSVEKIGGEYVIFLRDEGMPRLRVSSLYRRLASQGGEVSGQAKEYLRKKVQAATELVKSIHWRQQTLYRVTQSIFKFQRDFLEYGVSHLRPMVLKDVAQDIGMHESTVSRATANKYVHTPQGLFELKFFFQSGLRAGNGEDVAAETVKNKIRTLIAMEDPRRPYSDQHIAKLLNQEAIGIARRTVAKYREAMGILPSSKRRQPHLFK